MTTFLKKRWFLISLLVLATVGLALGTTAPECGRLFREQLFRPRLIVFSILFLMAFSLDSSRLAQAFRRPGPVLWASLVNYVALPLFGWFLVSWQQLPDFQMGLMVAVSVPCTLASASVWTRKARGNDAVSLLATILTNALCFLFTPFWLNLTTAQAVQLDPHEMMLRLLQAVLLPTFLGQLCRLVPKLRQWATAYKTPISVVAQCLVLSLVFMASWNAGTFLHQHAAVPSLQAVLIVWASVVLVHLVGVAVALVGAVWFGFDRFDWPAVVFAGSQKTLPIGAYLATDPRFFGNPNLLGPGVGAPFVIFPMLLYHASQLFVDTVLADYMAAKWQQEERAGQPKQQDQQTQPVQQERRDG